MVSGDEEQFRAFVDARWISLRRFAYLLTGDIQLAEDLVQTALANSYRRWAMIPRTDTPEAYVRRAIVNLNTSRWRRRFHEWPTGRVPEPTAPDRIAAFDRRDELWTALLRCPARMRAILALRYFEDLPEAEVAKILGCSVGTVKSQTSRGLDRLRDMLSTDTLVPTQENPDEQ